jgi:hypothetical protein
MTGVLSGYLFKGVKGQINKYIRDNWRGSTGDIPTEVNIDL